MTRHIEDPWMPADERELDTFSQHYIFTATCACGHTREIEPRQLLRRLGPVTIGKLRDALRCHRCQERRPKVEVRRIPR